MSRGRPGAAPRLVAAIDIGGTRTKLGIVDPDGSVLSRTSVPTPEGGDPTALVAAIAEALGPMREERRAMGEEIAGIGVSVAGFLDRDRAVMLANANLPRLCGFPLRPALEAALGATCRLEVDSNAAVLAEYRFGAGRGAARLLGVTLGTGVGAGVIVAGQLLRYTGECAGDLGHIIVAPGGRDCTCGARGCLEAMACSAAVSQRAGGRPVREVIEAAGGGDRAAAAALAETGHWLGLGLASLAPVFAPERIVVGGGIAAAGEPLLRSARDSFRLHAAPELAARVAIVRSTFEGWEGIIGAACAYFEE